MDDVTWWQLLITGGLPILGTAIGGVIGYKTAMRTLDEQLNFEREREFLEQKRELLSRAISAAHSIIMSAGSCHESSEQNQRVLLEISETWFVLNAELLLMFDRDTNLAAAVFSTGATELYVHFRDQSGQSSPLEPAPERLMDIMKIGYVRLIAAGRAHINKGSEQVIDIDSSEMIERIDDYLAIGKSSELDWSYDDEVR